MIGSKIYDYSPLFRGFCFRSDRLSVEDRGDISVLTIHGVEVIGSRQALERVREGLIRNGGPRHLFGHSKSF